MGINVGIQEVIAQARARVEAPVTRTCEVEESGATVEVVLTKMLGSDWIALTSAHAPRLNVMLDQNIGYDLDSTMADYPADKILVAGGPVTDAEWREWYGTLDAPWRNILQENAFALHQTEPVMRLVELGKASRPVQRKRRS